MDRAPGSLGGASLVGDIKLRLWPAVTRARLRCEKVSEWYGLRSGMTTE